MNSTASFQTNQRERKEPTPPRIVRRRLLFWLSLVPAFVVFLFGVHFTALNGVFDRAMGEYEAGEWREATSEFGEMRWPNIADPWKAHFNTGTAAYRADRIFLAEQALREALGIVPDEHRCDVQTNLALVYEGAARQFQEYSDREVEDAKALAEAEIARANGEPYDASLIITDSEGEEITSADLFSFAALDQRIAADYFIRAADAINDPACQSPPSPDASPEEQEQEEQEQEQRESEQERLEDEARDADDQRQELEDIADGKDPEEADTDHEPGNSGGGDGEDAGDDDGETEEERQAREEEERQEELDQRNEDAKEEAGGGDGDGGDGDADQDGENGGSGSPPISNW